MLYLCAIAELQSADYSVVCLRAPNSKVASTIHHRAENDSDIRLGTSDALSDIPPLSTLFEKPVVQGLQISAVFAGAWLPNQFCFL